MRTLTDLRAIDWRSARSGRTRRTSTLSRLPVGAWGGGVTLILIVLMAVFAPLISPYDPVAQNIVDRLQSPSAAHLLGTDELGRDVVSRLLFGARVSMLAVAEVLIIASLLGLPAGVVAGYYGRWIDTALSRIMDLAMSIPGLIIALTIVAIFGPSLENAMLAVGINMTPRFFRVARAATFDVRGQTYIEGGLALGSSHWRILTRHILPNIVPPILVVVTVSASSAVAAEASLSFLGLGVRPPTPSWGSMLSSAAANMAIAPILVWAPGLLILILVLAFTAAGDGVRVLLSDERGRGSGNG